MDTLDRLLDILEDENPAGRDVFRNLNKDDRFRALVNVRLPLPLSDEYLKLESIYLKEKIKEMGVVPLSSISFIDGMGIYRGNIINIEADAIVNAGNSALLGCFQPLHKCIDNWIHTYAGAELRYDIYETLKGREAETAEVLVTGGYNLPSRYIIHTVGPIVYGRVDPKDEALLKKTYLNCLEKAKELGLSSVVFPCISTGVFGYPKEEAAPAVVATVSTWLKENGYPLRVIFNVFEDIDESLYKGLLKNHG